MQMPRSSWEGEIEQILRVEWGQMEQEQELSHGNMRDDKSKNTGETIGICGGGSQEVMQKSSVVETPWNV